MLVGDIYMYRDDKYGRHLFWEVEAVMIGDAGQESLVRLRTLNCTPGRDEHGEIQETSLVPEPFLRGARRYARSDLA